MNKYCEWVALSYNVPINPSKNRVYIWRKLKELGAAYLKQGVAILPNTKENTDCFVPLASKIKDMGGEAVLIEMRFVDERDNIDMEEFFMTQTEREYNELLEDCKTVVQDLRKMANPMTDKLSSQLKSMVKRYKGAKSRDHFKQELSEELESGFQELSDTLRSTASDFSAQFRRMMEKQ